MCLKFDKGKKEKVKVTDQQKTFSYDTYSVG